MIPFQALAIFLIWFHLTWVIIISAEASHHRSATVPNLKPFGLMRIESQGLFPQILSIWTSFQNSILPPNFISRKIPPEVRNCTNLEYLELYNNTLTGEIPGKLFSLPNIGAQTTFMGLYQISHLHVWFPHYTFFQISFLVLYHFEQLQEPILILCNTQTLSVGSFNLESSRVFFNSNYPIFLAIIKLSGLIPPVSGIWQQS